jgi:hypothetical protein
MSEGPILTKAAPESENYTGTEQYQQRRVVPQDAVQGDEQRIESGH